jgi:hypothetical protein
LEPRQEVSRQREEYEQKFTGMEGIILGGTAKKLVSQ